MLKNINHLVLLQEWKPNLDAAAYEKILMLICLNLLKKIDFHDINFNWPTSIKYTIKWLPFLAIMKHTENIIKLNKGLIPSLLKGFTMF